MRVKELPVSHRARAGAPVSPGAGKNGPGHDSLPHISAAEDIVIPGTCDKEIIMGDEHCGIYGVILAAGSGSRLRPLSLHKPKPLLPICNKAIIQHQIEYMRDIGIRDFRIVVGHLGRHIMESFGSGEALGVNIRYVIQEQALGIAHAVYQLEDELDGPFLLFLGDILHGSGTVGAHGNDISKKSVRCRFGCDAGRSAGLHPTQFCRHGEPIRASLQGRRKTTLFQRQPEGMRHLSVRSAGL